MHYYTYESIFTQINIYIFFLHIFLVIIKVVIQVVFLWNREFLSIRQTFSIGVASQQTLRVFFFNRVSEKKKHTRSLARNYGRKKKLVFDLDLSINIEWIRD